MAYHKLPEGVSDYYDGSRVFSGVAQSLGLSVDKFNFIISQVVVLLLASLFRTALAPSKVSAFVRHAFGLVVGLYVGYFCFGTQSIHLAALPIACFLVIRTQNPKIIQIVVMVVALSYLSFVHIHRLIYDYGSSNLDITGPLMVITQKVTSLAFNLHDGLTKTDDEMTKMQKEYAVNKRPSALEYFGYCLQFPSLMAGPSMYYKEYMEFIVGQEGAPNNVSPYKVVRRKMLIATGCALVVVVLFPMFPISRVKNGDFLDNSSLSQKILYLITSTSFARFKYYFAWTLADAICNNSGIGYNGIDEDGNHKWDKFTNVDIVKFEFATNVREAIDAWNRGTNRWLKMIVYERGGKFSMPLTFALSAIWHGFYPGYYLTFANGFLFLSATKVARKTIRNYFLETNETKLFYDAMTFVTTKVLMAYMVFPFVLLEFWPSVRVYMHMYFFIHLIALGFIFLLPKLIPMSTGQLNSASKTSLAQAISQAVPITNGVSRHHD